MQLSQSMGIRMEQRQLLTPRMIQSMEILQLPLMALEERIEQELQNNPVLEVREGENNDDNTEAAPITDDSATSESVPEDERPMVVKEDDQAADFDRLARISEYLENEEFNQPIPGQRIASYDGER